MQIPSSRTPWNIVGKTSFEFFYEYIWKLHILQKGSASKSGLSNQLYLSGGLFKLYGNCDCGTAGLGIPELFESGEIDALIYSLKNEVFCTYKALSLLGWQNVWMKRENVLYLFMFLCFWLLKKYIFTQSNYFCQGHFRGFSEKRRPFFSREGFLFSVCWVQNASIIAF